MRLYAIRELATDGTVCIVPAKVHDTTDVEPMSTPREAHTVVSVHDIRTDGTLVCVLLLHASSVYV